MEESKKQILINAGVDIEGALERFMNNDALYWRFLQKFTANPNFTELEESLAQQNWERALEISHNLKGITGNLGFTKLYEMLVTQVSDLRSDQCEHAAALMANIREEHDRLLEQVRPLV